MMSFVRRLPIAIPTALLLLCLVAIWLTRGSMAHMPFRQGKGGAARSTSLVDQRPWQTIESLAPLAVSAEEQSLAREASRFFQAEDGIRYSEVTGVQTCALPI